MANNLHKMAVYYTGNGTQLTQMVKRLLLGSVVLVSVVSVVSVVLMVRDMGADDETFSESDESLLRMVRSIDAYTQLDKTAALRRHQARKYVEDHFPWLIQNNTMGNYFLNGGEIQPNREDYRTSAIVFLHQHRSAGTILTECLRNISRWHNFLQSSPFTSNKRHKFENSSATTQQDFERIKILTGQFSFGLCGKYQQRQCSSFTVFRDPLQRAISSYEYCKSATGDEMCRVLNANTVSLRDWILHQGSTTFLALTFNYRWCSTEANTVNSSPCWKHHKDTIDTLDTEERNELLQYILDNLEHWFSVVGIFDEMAETITMLEKAHILPFSTCNINEKTNTIQYHNTVLNAVSESVSNDMKRTRKRHNNRQQNHRNHVLNNINNNQENNANHMQHFTGELENQLVDLQYDYKVKTALAADYKIYTKARQIFDRQKELLYNVLL